MLYRIGETAKGVATYVPRVVSFDLGGSMGGVRRAGHLYGDDDAVNPDGLPAITSWDDGHRVFRQEPAHKSAFLRNLEEDAGDGYHDEEDDDEEDDENHDPDARMDTDESSDDEDDARGGRRRSKWGGSTKRSRNGGDVDAIAALRAKMASQMALEAERTAKNEKSDSRAPSSTETREERQRRRREDEERRSAALEASAAALDTDDAKSWTDFCKACFHPRSHAILPGLWRGVDLFAGFGEGVEHLRTEERREEARDAVRFWAEECDHLRGFQVFAEDLSGFGGVAATVLEELRDEYGTAPVTLFSLRPPTQSHAVSSTDARSRASRCALLNDALASSILAPMCDAYVPLGTPDQSRVSKFLPGYRGGDTYHSAAFHAAAIDTATLPWRVSDASGHSVGGTGMSSVVRHLSARAGGPFTAMTATTPCDAFDDPSVVAARSDSRKRDERRSQAGGDSLLSSRVNDMFAEEDDKAAMENARAVLSKQVYFTPGCVDEDAMEPTAEVYVARGWRVNGPDGSNTAATPSSARDALDAALRYEAYRAPRLRCAVSAPLPLPLPFPRVFGNGGDKNGGPNPRECAAMTRLVSTGAYGAVLTSINAGWKRAVRGSAGKAMVRSWGYGDDDLEEVSESLATAAYAYGGDEDGEEDEFEFNDEDEL